MNQLSERRSAELVRSLLEAGEVAPEILGLVLTRAGGNPLFVEELIRSLLDNGAIRRTDHRFELTREVSALEVPDTIQGVIAARMDRVGENLKQILQAASVIGTEFGCCMLENVMDQKEEVRASLLHLEGLEFICERQASPEPEYAFKHALTREVAYNSLLTHIRRETHEKAGKAIEELYPERLEEYCELLAYHYVRSDNTGKAVEYLSLANQKAEKAYALEEAMAYYEKAMELLDTLPETGQYQERRISLLVNQLNVFLLLFRVTEYYDLLTRYEPVTEKLPNHGLRGMFYGKLGMLETFRGNADQAIQTLTRAAELCQTAGYAKERKKVTQNLAFIYTQRGDYDRVFKYKEELLRTTDQDFDLRSYVWGLSSTSSQAYAHVGRWDEAVQLGQKALSVAKDYSDESLIAGAATLLSAVYTYKGDVDQAIKYGELGVAKAPTPTDKLDAQAFLAWALCHTGEPQRGIAFLAGIIPAVRAARFVLFELWCTLFLAEGYWLAGEYDKSRETAVELLKIAELFGAPFCTGYAYYLLGGISLETRPAEAAAHFDRSIAIFQDIKAENMLAKAYAGHGRLHRKLGDPSKARDYLSRALEIFERLGTLIEPDKVRRDLAELP